ncbi:hypothetical protein GCM10022277_19440 [Litoribacillus peritrichatus]|uniref:Integrase catalytic domain-containing protein n=2 Tax=Litoribacillus peritrichatus TaxID=718191 RepID=A0ABP7MII5_9GAMM
MFRLNEVLKVNEQRFRVLEFVEDHIVWIDIDDDSALPELITEQLLLDSIESELLERVDDPFQKLIFEVPEEGTTARVKRDKNYQLIKPLIDSPDFYLPKHRNRIINEILEEQGSTKQTLYRLARRFWQRGQTPNTLLPDYKNSGGKGKRRFASGKKLGRPRKDTSGTGAQIDEEIERLFRIVIDKYVLNDKGEENKHPISYAYRRFQTMYLTYFPDTPEDELPTNWQMMHFYKREYSQSEILKKKVSKIVYNKDIRPLHSTANSNVLGPGSRYEIDATIADIYLVSDSERGNIVGRPVIYMVIDVFSRMVAGFYIGFENASYAAAMQALYMSMVDKTSYCQNLGFDISSDDWPSIGLPDAILADRGELLGHQIENLENIFAVRIENTPSYRGDAKGIVERNFKTIQADFSPFAPGYVTGNKIKKRGGKDYRLDSKISILDFTKILLSSVIYHNKYAVLKKYDRDADMPTDLPSTPIHLWNWGLQHRTGRLRAASEDGLRIALLPRVKATISELGVRVFGIYFTSQEVIQSGWMHRGKNVKRPASIEAAYDPACADHIYLLPEKNTQHYWICNLAERSRQYKGASFWDVWQVEDAQKKTHGKAGIVATSKKREHEEFVLEQIKKAAQTSPDTSEIPKSERIAAINGNKAKEKIKERSENAYRPNSTKKESEAEVVYITAKDDDLDFPDYIDELFGEDD